jgi:type I restriction enzyme M protein
LRLNFEATAVRIARLDEQSAFAALAVSKKRKDAKAVEAEEAAGRAQQKAIRAMLTTLAPRGRYVAATVSTRTWMPPPSAPG